MSRRYGHTLLFWAGALLAVAAACGGGDRAEIPQANETPPSAETPLAESTSPADETAVACAAPLLLGEAPVTFRGRVTGQPVHGALGTDYQWSKVGLRIDEVEVVGTPVTGQNGYVPGQVVDVFILGQNPPVVRPGDCVLVSGDVHRWACGAACDAGGFVAERFVRLK